MTGATTLTFLSPLGGLLVLAAALPLAGLVLATRRVAAARTLLGLDRPPGGAAHDDRGARRRARAARIAAAQPAIRAPETANVRTDAQAMFVIDTSRSMLLARSAPGEPTRLAPRERGLAPRLLIQALDDVSAGVGTLTDHALLPEACSRCRPPGRVRRHRRAGSRGMANTRRRS